MKQEIIAILMKRDGVTRREAFQMFEEANRLIQEAISSGNVSEVENILLSQLGLEMDYIYAFI